MKLKKEKTDATKKKGMALNDDALENVTGGRRRQTKLPKNKRKLPSTL